MVFQYAIICTIWTTQPYDCKRLIYCSFTAFGRVFLFWPVVFLSSEKNVLLGNRGSVAMGTPSENSTNGKPRVLYRPSLKFISETNIPVDSSKPPNTNIWREKCDAHKYKPTHSLTEGLSRQPRTRVVFWQSHTSQQIFCWRSPPPPTRWVWYIGTVTKCIWNVDQGKRWRFARRFGRQPAGGYYYTTTYDPTVMYAWQPIYIYMDGLSWDMREEQEWR